VNSKFQLIQSAHEVLIDPEQKAKYDASRVRTSRYPTASGVKGNPWQNAGSQYPPPPRRSASTRQPPSSGASRYNNFPNVPPTAKKPTTEDQETKRDNWRAFQNMRASSSNHASGSAKAPKEAGAKPDAKPSTSQNIPRTPSQKQRQEASFGNRKSGYYPRSPVPEDEPPVTSKNYATSRHTSNLFNDTAAAGYRRRRGSSNLDPVAQARENFMDSRISTPYQTHGGEKLNPFEGVPLGRDKSSRDPSRLDPEEGSPGRHRSSSVPRPSNGGEHGPGLQVPSDDERPHTANDGNFSNGSFASRASARTTSPAFSGDQARAAGTQNGNTCE
jgi:curved DNA-binding protein CbpA